MKSATCGSRPPNCTFALGRGNMGEVKLFFAPVANVTIGKKLHIKGTRKRLRPWHSHHQLRLPDQ